MPLPNKRTTETMSISEARRNFSEVVTRPLRGEGRVIVAKSGTPVGAIVSMEDVRRLESLDREWAEIEEVFRRTQSGFKGLSNKEVEHQIERAIAEVEADYRAERKAKPESER
jgi:prevent-host-death family protein